MRCPAGILHLENGGVAVRDRDRDRESDHDQELILILIVIVIMIVIMIVIVIVTGVAGWGLQHGVVGGGMGRSSS